MAGDVPGCAALGSAVAVGVGVLVGGPVQWWCGKCFLLAPLTLGGPSESRGESPWVLTSGGLTHVVFVSWGITQNSTRTSYLAVFTPRVSEFPERRKYKGM